MSAEGRGSGATVQNGLPQQQNERGDMPEIYHLFIDIERRFSIQLLDLSSIFRFE